MRFFSGVERKISTIFVIAAAIVGAFMPPLVQATTVYSNPNASAFAFCGGDNIEDIGFVSVLPGNAVTVFAFASASSQFGGGFASFAIFSDPSHLNLLQAGSLGAFGFPGGGIANYTVFVPGFLPSGYWQISLNSACSPIASTAGYTGVTIDQELSPPELTSLRQFAADGTTPILQGGVTVGTTVIFTASIQASTSADPLQFQLEIQPSANDFTGNSTEVASFSGGQFVTTSVANLSNGSYHWAARTFDTVTHAASSWQPFSTSTIDFVVADALVQTSSTILTDATTSYSAGNGSVGGCCPNFVMGPGPVFYHAPSPFAIQSIVVDDTDLSLNNHDGSGNIRARISDLGGSTIASSTNSIYGESGCTGCGFQFQNQAVPQDFQLSLVVEDGIQGDGFFTVKNLRFFVAPQAGTITVSTNNAAATFSITDGASNTLTGSGVSFIQMAPPGTYTIHYGDVPGFITPFPATASLDFGTTITFSGNYVALPQPLGAPGPTNQQQLVAEPVSSGTGNYYYQHTDFSIPGRGKPLVFQRTYNTLDNCSGPLGSDWTHTYNVTLTQTQDTVTIKWDDGHSEIFLANGLEYLPQPGVFSALTKNADGSFTLTKKDQTRYEFAATGKLSVIRDRNGNTTILSYDILGNLVQVANGGGGSLNFSYDSNNRIVQVIDPAGRTELFQYDASSNLSETTDPAGGITAFAYDTNHRVLSITLPSGQTLLQNSYDGAGRVVSQTNGLGHTWFFAYNTPSPGDTTITDARGNKTVHTYDSLLRIVQITDADGGITTFAYDANNNRTSVTNQNRNTTSFAYDSQGNIMGITDPFANTVNFTYDPQNNLLTATNAKGRTTAFAYDNFSNLTSIKDAPGSTAIFAYDGFGQLISKTDARGNVTNFTYDPSGNLTKITDALGNATTLSYDGIGRLTALTDPNGHTATAAYDSLSRLVKVSDPLGNQTQFAYDPVGNLLKIIDAKGNATSYAYDATNNLTTVTDALQHVTQYAYDSNNNRVKFTNAKGNATFYTFDVLNRLSGVADPLGFVSSYQYDLAGNVIETTDAKGQINKFSYDALNRLIGIAYADGKTVAYVYDANGNRISMGDTHGTTTYVYDALDRLTSVNHPGGKVVGYSYDGVGNRIQLTYPDGKVAGYSYDAANRLSQAADWLGRSTNYGYDPAGNLIRTAYPNGASIAFAYDAANRLSKIVNAAALSAPMVALNYTLDSVGNRTGLNINGLPISFGYDALNELTSAQLGLLKTSWTYDAVGNRLKEIGPTGTINYTYDGADRLLQAGMRLFTYDANGNETSATMSLTGTPVIYQYDAANRLIAASGFMPSAFSYDGDGNRVGQSVGSGTYNYINDVAAALPVVLQESGPDGPITYEYGLSLIEAFSPEFNFFYHYDGLGSVIALTNTAGKPAAAYAYDPWGNALLDIPDSVGTKNKFRFTGEALDPGTQLYYLRMRYYDTSTGRLHSVDPLALLQNMDSTVLKYGYATNNPTIQIDPTGALSLRAAEFQVQAFGTTVVEGLATDLTILGSKVVSAATLAAAKGEPVVTAVAKTAAKEAGNASQFIKLSVLGSVTGFAITAGNEVLISNFGREKLVHITGLDLATGVAGSIIGTFVGPEGTVIGAVIGGAIGADLGSLLIPKIAK